MALSRLDRKSAWLASDGEKPGPSRKMAADDVMGSWDGARQEQ